MAKYKKQFEELLKFESQEEELEHNATMVSFKFLSEVEKQCEKQGINRSDLSKKLGTSRGYVTQLFRGDKKLNMIMIAKLEKALGINFSIKVVKESN